MNKTFASIELQDGTAVSDVRVTLQDKLQFERTARVKKWDAQENFFTFAAFVAWHATKREGHHDLSWEDFEKNALDATVRTEGEDGGEAEDGIPDLTRS